MFCPYVARNSPPKADHTNWYTNPSQTTVNDEQGYEQQTGVVMLFLKQLETAVNVHSLTTNQKVADSSPAERITEIPANGELFS